MQEKQKQDSTKTNEEKQKQREAQKQRSSKAETPRDTKAAKQKGHGKEQSTINKFPETNTLRKPHITAPLLCQ